MILRLGGMAERLCREEWNIGFIPQGAADIVRRGIVTTPRWCKAMHPWYGLADPAAIVTANGITILAERPNYLTGRGEIWSAVLKDDPTQINFTPWIKTNLHLSYPFPFQGDGDLMFTMEAGESGSLWLCSWPSPTGQWEKRKIMDRPAIDPTIWRDENGWWLFCTFADAQPCETLHLFFADQVEGPWTPHPSNPIKTNRQSSRPAGPIFRADGRLIRPSQDCTETYGGAVVLNAITSFDRHHYTEVSVRRLAPLSDYPDGLHTFCPINDTLTIIDGKRWAFNLFDPMRYLLVGLQNHRRQRREFKTYELADTANY